MTPRVKDRAALEREILEEMKDDYLGLWEIARLVSTELGFEDNETAVYETTLQILESMIMEDLIRPGVPTDDGEFKPWTTGPGRSMRTISEEWAQLGRMPTVGDVAWFDLTDWGEKVASPP
jgi:hypothetical protein